METSSAIIIAILGLSITTLPIPRIKQLGIGFIGLVLLEQFSRGFDPEDAISNLFWVLKSMIIVGLLLNITGKKYSYWLAPVATLSSFILMTSTASTGSATEVEATFHYFNYPLVWETSIAILPFLGALIPIISRELSKLLNRFFSTEIEQGTTIIALFFGAFLIFYSTFQAQYFGLVLIGIGWLATALALRNNNLLAAGIGFLSFGFIFSILKTDASIEISFLRGNFIMGILTGFGVVSWLYLTENTSKFKGILSFIFPLLIVFGFTCMGLANENFGGKITYVGVLIGSTIGLFRVGLAERKIALHSYLLAGFSLVICLFPTAENPVQQQNGTTTTTPESTVSTPDILDKTAIELTAALAGKWTYSAASTTSTGSVTETTEKSFVNFQLGPEGGITKGALTDYKVDFQLDATGQPTSLSVTIPTLGISTLNAMRDKSIWGAGYLNATAFPKVTYTSTAIQKTGDTYTISGDLDFLGKKQPVSLTIKFVEKGQFDKSKDPSEFLVMVGKTTFNRTKHGMKSDAKIGDDVALGFQIQLVR